MKLSGKICVITGGASGIGRASALLFAHHGATVVVADLSESSVGEVARSAGGESIGIAADVSYAASMEALFDTVASRFGRLDVMVNNAGFGLRADITQTTAQDWDRLLAVNVTGVYHGCRLAIPLLRRSGGGVIVNTASVAGLVGVKDRAAYCATKGAVVAMTRAMALDHVKDGIRVNAVAPGTIDSPYFENIFAGAPDPAALRRTYEARQPMDRMGTPEEVAEGILWLASAESAFVTGTILTIDGGMTAQ
ncbi:SDR family oxidoreductase [Variovorax sp. LjRoot290]|uniref:SDR family oxidoreductase n=1 Tax=Variovorax sp. LjRoot290 TaxID=3342316 RepID=UPI003ECE64CD